MTPAKTMEVVRANYGKVTGTDGTVYRTLERGPLTYETAVVLPNAASALFYDIGDLIVAFHPSTSSTPVTCFSKIDLSYFSITLSGTTRTIVAYDNFSKNSFLYVNDNHDYYYATIDPNTKRLSKNVKLRNMTSTQYYDQYSFARAAFSSKYVVLAYAIRNSDKKYTSYYIIYNKSTGAISDKRAGTTSGTSTNHTPNALYIDGDVIYGYYFTANSSSTTALHFTSYDITTDGAAQNTITIPSVTPSNQTFRVSEYIPKFNGVIFAVVTGSGNAVYFAKGNAVLANTTMSVKSDSNLLLNETQDGLVGGNGQRVTLSDDGTSFIKTSINLLATCTLNAVIPSCGYILESPFTFLSADLNTRQLIDTLALYTTNISNYDQVNITSEVMPYKFETQTSFFMTMQNVILGSTSTPKYTILAKFDTKTRYATLQV